MGGMDWIGREGLEGMDGKEGMRREGGMEWIQIVREGWNGKVGMRKDGNSRVVKGWMG